MKTRDIVVDGVRLHVTEAGRGPALLMLHGLSATHVNWEHTMAAFSDRFRVIAPDLPGHGRSDKPDAPYTIDFFAGVMRSLRTARAPSIWARMSRSASAPRPRRMASAMRRCSR